MRWNVTWTAAANFVYLGSQYGMLVVLAKLGSTTMVGEFSLGLAIVTPVITLGQMQLRQVFVTDTRDTVPFAAFFWTRALSGGVAVIACGALLVFLRYEQGLALVIASLAVAKFVESQSDIVYGSLQRRERMHLIAASMMVRGTLGLAAITGGLWATGTLLGATTSLAVVWVLSLLFLDLPLLTSGRPGDSLRWRWDGKAVAGLVRISTPLALASGMVALSASIPRYFLDYFHGKEAVALFAVAMMPISLMGLFTGALSQAALPRASWYLQSGNLPSFHNLARKIAGVNVILGTCLVLIVVFAGPQLVRVLFTPEYEPAVPMMVVLGAGVALSGLATFGSTVLSAGRRFTLQLANVVIALAVQIPACLLAVPLMGAPGAAWAEFSKFGATTMFLEVTGRRVYKTLQPSV